MPQNKIFEDRGEREKKNEINEQHSLYPHKK